MGPESPHLVFAEWDVLLLYGLDLFDGLFGKVECARIVPVDQFVLKGIVEHEVKQGFDFVLHGGAGVLLFASDGGRPLFHTALYMTGTNIHNPHTIDCGAVGPGRFNATNTALCLQGLKILL